MKEYPRAERCTARDNLRIRLVLESSTCLTRRGPFVSDFTDVVSPLTTADSMTVIDLHDQTTSGSEIP